VRRIVIRSALLALIINLVAVRPALAYIDPNTGGLLFQVLATALALFSGVALIFSRQIRMAFARAKRFLRSLLNHGDLQTQDTPVNLQSADTQVEAD
jgi:hypothetical protein